MYINFYVICELFQFINDEVGICMLLVITACIDVDNNTPYVILRNPDVRFQQYLQTIEWAICETLFDEIIFCDNSGYLEKNPYDFSSLMNIANKKSKAIEIYSFFMPNIEVTIKGKGWGEGRIIDYLFLHSERLNRSKVFYKITGRLMVSNIEKLEISSKKKNQFMFDVVGKTVDTRFYKICTEDYRDYLLDAYKESNDKCGLFLEHVFFKKINDVHMPYERFVTKPAFIGQSGTTGELYHDAPQKKNRFTDILYRSFLYKTYWGRAILKKVRTVCGHYSHM